MSNQIIQANYDQLEMIGSRLGALAEQADGLRALVRRSKERLEPDWQGRGSDAFFAEMRADIFPALIRLSDALSAARQVTLASARIMRQAEEEAASLFAGWYTAPAPGHGAQAGHPRPELGGHKTSPSDNARPRALAGGRGKFISHSLGYLDGVFQQPGQEEGGNDPVPQPPITSREDWGAREPDFTTYEGQQGFEGYYDPEHNDAGYAPYSELRPGEELGDILDTVVIHHVGIDSNQTVQDIQNKHMDSNHWADIGYHYIIAPDGTIYEGRPLDVRGRHVDSANTGKVGILFLGDYEPDDTYDTNAFGLGIRVWVEEAPDQPTSAQIDSAKQLIGWLDTDYGIDSVVGHNDVPGNDTECPGDELEAILPELDAVAQER